MSTNPDGPRRGRWPWGLVGMIGLVAGVEAGLARRQVDFTNEVYASWERGRQTAGNEAARAEVLCFGDSIVKLGVAPKVLEERMGKRAYNCAVIGGSAPLSYFLLRRAIESGARPAAVVVDFKAFILSGGPRFQLRQWAEVASPRDALDLAWTSRDAAFFAETATRLALVSYRDRPEVRANVLAALRGEPTPSREPLMVHWRNWNANLGAKIMPESFQFSGVVKPEEAVHYAPDSWRCDPVNAAYVRRFCDLAASRDIPVFWLLGPATPPLQALRDAHDLEAPYDRLARRIQAHCPNVVVVDGRHSGYDSPAFSDPVHLNARGACVFSAQLANVLTDHLRAPRDTPRWVHLPAPEPAPAALPVEDLNASALAVRERLGSAHR